MRSTHLLLVFIIYCREFEKANVCLKKKTFPFACSVQLRSFRVCIGAVNALSYRAGAAFADRVQKTLPGYHGSS